MSEYTLVASAMGVLSGAVSTAKNAVELAKNSKDHDLKNAVSDVLDTVLAAKLKVVELGDENRALEAQVALLTAKLAERGKITRTDQFGYWYKEGDLSPLCPKCYEGGEKLAYLSPLEEMGSYIGRNCRVCNWRNREALKSTNASVTAVESIAERARGYWE